MNIETLSVNYLRVMAANIIERANSGHPGISLDAAPIVYAMYKSAKFNPKDPKYYNRDRICFSAGHGSALFYSMLNLLGFDITLDDLKSFKTKGSKCTGHPDINTPGIDVSTGPLGQGIANAVGMAIAERHLAARFNRPDNEIIDHYTYVLAGEGCLMEGVGQEAISLAGNLALNKLILLYDCNKVSIEGPTDITMTEDVKAKFRACEWNVITVKNGNNVFAISNAIKRAKKSKKPTAIIVKTTIGYGSPVAGLNKAHGTPIGEAGIAYLKQYLKYNYEDYEVPPRVKWLAEKLVANSYSKVQEDTLKLEGYRTAYPSDYQAFVDYFSHASIRQTPLKLDTKNAMSTRDASHEVLNALKIDNIIGGCADLCSSTKAYLNDGGDFSKTNYIGKNIHFGVREHAMGAITNGIVLHGGLNAYCSTFFSFSNYMLPSIRMAALMSVPSIYIFSHDSIAVGQDGSTHQPVEQLTQLRAIPNLDVIRPANVTEMMGAMYQAFNNDRPTAILTSRQKLKPIENKLVDTLKGGYVLSNGKGSITIVATGSEVDIALDVKEMLAKKGVDVKVVSMPCLELYLRQPESYRNSVINPKDKLFVIEASNDTVWYKMNPVAVYNVNDFGFTASQEDLYEEFGLTATNISKDIATKIK